MVGNESQPRYSHGMDRGETPAAAVSSAAAAMTTILCQCPSGRQLQCRRHRQCMRKLQTTLLNGSRLLIRRPYGRVPIAD